MKVKIFQLVYRSIAEDSFKESDFDKILKTAKEFNPKNELTGLLIYRSRSFLQLLEGPERSVRDLYSRIRMDPRHQAVVTLFECKSDQRLYPNWSMAFVDESKARGSVDQLFDLFDDVIKGSPSSHDVIIPILKKFKGVVTESRS